MSISFRVRNKDGVEKKWRCFFFFFNKLDTTKTKQLTSCLGGDKVWQMLVAFPFPALRVAVALARTAQSRATWTSANPTRVSDWSAPLSDEKICWRFPPETPQRKQTSTGIILYMRPANERRRYNVTSSLIRSANKQNDPCVNTEKKYQRNVYHCRRARPIFSVVKGKDTHLIQWPRQNHENINRCWIDHR